MNKISSNSTRVMTIVLLILTVFCFSIEAGAAPGITTDKATYQFGETIRVNYFDAPGLANDWISIVPAGSPDSEPGDYQYTPRGVTQGTLVFNCPHPGNYEVRAYYNYSRNRYRVAARHVFSVAGDMKAERKIDPNNPLETNIPSGEGVVYLFRESFFLTNFIDIPIKIDGKPVVVLPHTSYFRLITPPGNLRITADSYLTTQPPREENPILKPAFIALEIKPGTVYFVKLRIQLREAGFFDRVPYREGEASIKSNSLTLIQ